MEMAYLLIGSNLGDRLRNLDAARQSLSGLGKLNRVSAIYETEPWGLRDQPHFLNQAMGLETSLSPQEMHRDITAIEKELGKTDKTHRFGARIIDIDILLFGSSVIESEELVIPHPRMHLRRFTLVPLNSIGSTLIHPLLNKTVQDLLAECPDQLRVNPLES